MFDDAFCMCAHCCVFSNAVPQRTPGELALRMRCCMNSMPISAFMYGEEAIDAAMPPCGCVSAWMAMLRYPASFFAIQLAVHVDCRKTTLPVHSCTDCVSRMRGES